LRGGVDVVVEMLCRFLSLQMSFSAWGFAAGATGDAGDSIYRSPDPSSAPNSKSECSSLPYTESKGEWHAEM